ncbi:hypothetical protein BaRGS_00023687 [Batillaria attramentaria]|uniref:Uncharacterized protein n=1 Tax=Batillaria attramentaria TaxID=370345 RepID=A0ABD0KD14_9CAEN
MRGGNSRDHCCTVFHRKMTFSIQVTIPAYTQMQRVSVTEVDRSESALRCTSPKAPSVTDCRAVARDVRVVLRKETKTNPTIKAEVVWDTVEGEVYRSQMYTGRLHA